ncbi:MAG TPA: acyltransferase [Geothrix sp.]|nr:acyltransferase [Geothrix sp.]
MNPTSVLPAFRRLALPVIRIPSILRAWVFLRRTRLGRRVRLLRGGRLRVEGASRITVSDRAWFNCGPVPTALVCAPEGEILIGVHTGFNYGASLRARHSIRIGEECMFGAMAMVRDHDGQRTAPVVIGDRVWLGHGVIIEPGVTIGDDAVISAGSVVLEDVPPRMIAMGNPARCLPLKALRRPSEARGGGVPPERAGTASRG